MTRRVRVWILLALLAVGGVSLLATPHHETYWEYYTDSSYSTLCGEKWVLCTGVVSWGVPSQYHIISQGPDC